MKNETYIQKNNQAIKSVIDITIDNCFNSINDADEIYNIDNLIKKLKLVKKANRKGIDYRILINKPKN